jgi:hypothetical protein
MAACNAAITSFAPRLRPATISMQKCAPSSTIVRKRNGGAPLRHVIDKIEAPNIAHALGLDLGVRPRRTLGRRAGPVIRRPSIRRIRCTVRRAHAIPSRTSIACTRL